jgi:hypothetical protein
MIHVNPDLTRPAASVAGHFFIRTGETVPLDCAGQ